MDLLYSLLLIVATTAKDVHQAPVVPDENSALGSAIEGGATPTHLAAPEANHRRMGLNTYETHERSCVRLGTGYGPLTRASSGSPLNIKSRNLAYNIDLWNNVYPPGWGSTLPGGSVIQHPVRPFNEDDDSQTPSECKALCDANKDCKGFEYGVNYGGKGGNGGPFPIGYFEAYPHGIHGQGAPGSTYWHGKYWYWSDSENTVKWFGSDDCILKNTADYGNCDGSSWNLDFYVKIPAAEPVPVLKGPPPTLQIPTLCCGGSCMCLDMSGLSSGSSGSSGSPGSSGSSGSCMSGNTGTLMYSGSWSLCVERLSVIGCGCVSSRSSSISVFTRPPVCCLEWF